VCFPCKLTYYPVYLSAHLIGPDNAHLLLVEVRADRIGIFGVPDPTVGISIFLARAGQGAQSSSSSRGRPDSSASFGSRRFTTFREIWAAPRSRVETVYPTLMYFHEVDRGACTRDHRHCHRALEFQELPKIPDGHYDAEIARIVEKHILEPIDVAAGPLFGMCC
jgi:hypothetical protein